ncbi:hypothetical protein LCGC14_2894340 [marine sediment metagenome]|uniref:3-octaprenyl-4-hydroxybenzoate carboxy-lyase-like N-terminal domain-containing protein n=1 Tax=marine sediment metagenome TaxID=412755 RepID=A0A0F8XWC8_9ZZZZ
MPCKDLREYLEVLDKAGELVRITEEVDWYLEAGAIARRAQDLRVPAPLLQRVKGYPEGVRLFRNTFGPNQAGGAWSH